MQHQQHAQRGLSHPAMLILGSLVQGPKDAVMLCEAIQQTEGLFFEPGTLYRVLAPLEQRGWIEALTTEHPLRLYSITALGLLAFERAEASRQGEKLREGGRPLLLRGKEIIMRLVLWMLRLYPPAWRERYETEMGALLGQHEITLWTTLDLLIGALDARLDPHYRRSSPLLPWKQLETSWKLYAGALVAFCFALLLWFSMIDMSQNLAGTGDSCSSPGYYYPRCMMRLAVALQTPAVASAIVVMMSLLAFFGIFFLLVALALWVVTQTIRRKNGWNLLRLLPIASFILLFQLSSTSPALAGWLNVLVQVGFVASVALLMESGGAMFVSGSRWEQCPDRLLTTLGRLLALLVTVGMVTVCIASGAWLVAIWDLFPRINLYYPGTQTQLLVGFIMMVLASMSAFFALIRGSRALRAMYAANLPQRDRRTDPKVLIMVLSVGLFVFIGLMMLGFIHVTPTMMLLIPLSAGLGSMMIALAVKKYRVEIADLPKQESLQQVQQAHEQD